MTDVKWIKITTDIFDDEKIKLIDAMPDRDAVLVIWIKLLTLAGKCNNTGTLVISESMPYTDEMLAAVFSRPLNTIRLALQTFENLGMIECHNAITIVNWEKHQNEAALAIMRERERDRKRIQRANKLAPCPGLVPDLSHCVRSLEIDKELELDTELDKRKSSRKSNRGALKSYGIATPVMLSDSEYEKLLAQYGKMYVEIYVKKMSLWEPTSGKRHKDDYKAMLRWMDKDKIPTLPPPAPKCEYCGLPMIDGCCHNVKCPQYE